MYGYVRYAYKYIIYIPINKPIYYLLNVIYCIINYETFGHNCYQTNTKLKHKDFFKLWTQRKGEHNNIKSEYIQYCDM